VKKCIFVIFGLILVLHNQIIAQQAGIPDAAELEIALHKLNVLGSVLYVGAHPDDENSSLLAYFSKGRKYRSAYLSVTRGEGGQNLIGPEQGAEIGILRTQELMSARRIDGAEQFFTRAIDFGYSKTAEETFDFWGKEKTLGDIVWVIRKFQPDVIITRFTSESSGGHGHHTASALLLKDAFTAAADPSRFPGQLKFVSAWRAKRLLWNRGRFRQEEIKTNLRVDTGEYDPLLGKSYSEMAGESRSQHKSQGFGSAGRRGSQLDYFELMAGDPATKDIFDGIDTSWNRVPGAQKVGLLLAKSIGSFNPLRPSQSIPGLLGVYSELAGLEETYWVRQKKDEVLRVIQACSGLWLEAIASDFAAAPGDSVQIRTSIVNRSDSPFTWHSLGIPKISPDSILDRALKNNDLQTVETTVRLPKDIPISQPYWLETSARQGQPSDSEFNLLGLAENPPSISVRIILSVGGNLLEYSIPLLFRWTDQVQGELYRNFEIRPRVTIQVEDGVGIFSGETPREIKVKLKSHSQNVSGTIRLKGSDAWRTTPVGVPFSLAGKYEESEVAFEISPPKSEQEAVLTAEAEVDGEKIERALVEISYPHIHRQVYFPPSQIKVVKLDVKTEGKRLGYIMGAGDEVAESLRHLGYEVEMLSDEMLETEDLSRFDAIVTGVRAYNTRERLKPLKERLLQYVERGGSLIVQYNVASAQLAGRIGPYPFTIGRDRVSVENAPVTFLAPDHPLLNIPNKITSLDFEGWIQERGLYFASDWDNQYETVLASHDPGEPDKKGGLLFARYGKGVFIYTAYAWFRELPAGVPGAFRLFANMISAGKHTGKPTPAKK